MQREPKNADRREAAEVVLMLPWYAAGTLSRRDRARVEAVLRQYPELRDQVGLVREELAETIHLNETLGVPSPQVADRLMAAIDAEAAPARRRVPGATASWLTGFFANLSPRTLAVAASFACLAIALQSVAIVDMATAPRTVEYRGIEPTERLNGTFVLVRFAPQASAADVTELLQEYRAAVIDGPTADGLYRVRIAPASLSKEELGRLMHRLRQESIVASAEVATPGQ